MEEKGSNYWVGSTARWVRGVFLTVLLVASFLSTALGDLTDLYAKTNPSIVILTVYSSTGEKLAQGSGFIVDKSGIIVTCHHVVADAATVEVTSADESVHIAKAVIRVDKDWDVALLKVDPLPQAALKMAPPEAVQVGASVVAIGSPLGYGNSLSQGIISGLREHGGDSDLIQFTAPISPGSSGGPILSPTTNDVLGMTVATDTSGQNINFAIPSRVIASLLKAKDQPPERTLNDFSPEAKLERAKEKALRDSLEAECTPSDARTINDTIEQAIDSGAGIYNSGDHLACYRMYDGAAYKMLFILNGRTPTAIDILKTALQKAKDAEDSPEAATAQAWIMRHAFDSMVGLQGKRSANPNSPIISSTSTMAAPAPTLTPAPVSTVPTSPLLPFPSPTPPALPTPTASPNPISPIQHVENTVPSRTPEPSLKPDQQD